MTEWKIGTEQTFGAPIWEAHKRGKNWAAVLDGPNFQNVQRRWLKLDEGEGSYDASALQPGDAIEVGADYHGASSGYRKKNRAYYVVIARRPESLEVKKCDTGAEAMRRGSEIRAATRPTSVPAEMPDPESFRAVTEQAKTPDEIVLLAATMLETAFTNHRVAGGRVGLPSFVAEVVARCRWEV